MAVRPPTNHVLFSKLTESVNSKNCIAILGAGVSSPDYPLWTELTEKLRGACGVRAEDLISNESPHVLEVARSKSPDKFLETLRTIFASSKNPKCANRYHMIARIPFLHIVTLNFDPLLVDIIGLHRNVTVSKYPWIMARDIKRSELVYLHGCLDGEFDEAKWPLVLTQKDFEKAYDPDGSLLHGFLQMALLGNDVCFLGCNPTEPSLARLFEKCAKLRRQFYDSANLSKPNWYALLDEETWDRKPLDDAGINAVLYPKIDDGYLGFDQVLECWADKKEPFVRRNGPSAFDSSTELPR
jgi:hypothetical protein